MKKLKEKGNQVLVLYKKNEFNLLFNYIYFIFLNIFGNLNVVFPEVENNIDFINTFYN